MYSTKNTHILSWLIIKHPFGSMTAEARSQKLFKCHRVTQNLHFGMYVTETGYFYLKSKIPRAMIYLCTSYKANYGCVPYFKRRSDYIWQLTLFHWKCCCYFFIWFLLFCFHLDPSVHHKLPFSTFVPILMCVFLFVYRNVVHVESYFAEVDLGGKIGKMGACMIMHNWVKETIKLANEIPSMLDVTSPPYEQFL